MIVCLLQGFLQKFCIGREMSYSSTGLQRTKRIGGALQLGFRIDGYCDCTIAMYTVYRAI